MATTCLAEGAFCGTIPDGCGGTLSCGTCGNGATCSANVCGTTYFIGPASRYPSASDSNPGTSESAPLATFTGAFNKLQPGDELVLLDGTYTHAETGLLVANCQAGPARNGTPLAPITVRAQHLRQAFLTDDGTHGALVKLYKCSDWNIIGLRARSNDAVRPASVQTDSVYMIFDSDHIQVTRCFGAYNDRLYNSHVFSADYSTHITISDSEAYAYHRHGFDVMDSLADGGLDDVAFQRDYADALPVGPCDAAGSSLPDGGIECGWDLVCDARGLCGGIAGSDQLSAGLTNSCVTFPYPDGGRYGGCFADGGNGKLVHVQCPVGARCGHASHTYNWGDEGVTAYWAHGAYIENCITSHGEGQQATGHGTLIEGGVSLDEVVGVSMGRNENGEGDDAVIKEGGNLARDMIVVNPLNHGVRLCSSNDDEIDGVTVYTSGIAGLLSVGKLAPYSTSSFCQPSAQNQGADSFAFRNSAVFAPTGGSGIDVEGTFTSMSAVSDVNVWLTHPGTALIRRILPSDGGVTWTDITSNAVLGTGLYDPDAGTGAIVFVPSNSPLHGAGINGADIGGNATCLYDRGTRTNQPMWNQSDGRFVGCDFYTPGSNQDIAAQLGWANTCANVSKRLNVGANGGAIPACQ